MRKGWIELSKLKTKAKHETHALFGVAMDGSVYHKVLATGPHWIIAGTTGSGKSVGLNSMLISMLSHTTPDEVQLIMVDPKKVEFEPYKNSPYCLVNPITDMKDAVAALEYLVVEMERRYTLLSETNFNGTTFKKVETWNDWVDNNEELAKERSIEKFPYIICIVDEWADLVAQDRGVDKPMARLGQKSRAAGIHVIIATQRPSVDVLSSIIKANVPSRICFKVLGANNSRVVLDRDGAEEIVNPGEALVMYGGEFTRVQFPYILDDEIANILKSLIDRYGTNTEFNYKQVVVDAGNYRWEEEYDDSVPWQERRIVPIKKGMFG